MHTDDSREDDFIERLRERLRTGRRASRGPDCPDEDRLRLLVPGLVDKDEAGRMIAHTAECDWCGGILREALQDLAEPPTAEELERAASNRLGHPKSRRALAKRLAAGAVRPGEWSFVSALGRMVTRWWPVAPAAACASLYIVILFQLGWLWGAPAAQRLLARDYTRHRQMEVRLPAAGYGTKQSERTAGRSSLDRLDLLEAETRIGRGIGANPDDPVWLQLAGQADLQEGRYDSAIAELDRAHTLRPTDADTLCDLGAAYLQKAEKTADPKLYSSAFESFAEGFKLKPRDLTLAFNQAVAAEHIYAFHEARDAWEKYLRMDSSSGWATEARQHQARVTEKLDRQRAYAAATTPDALIAELRRAGPSDRLFASDEEYLKIAVTRLLPDYYSFRADDATGKVLRGLADRLAARHGDTWLREVLRTAHSHTAAEAFTALGQTAEAEEAGEGDRARESAALAGRLFRAAGNEAGALRAALGGVIALQSFLTQYSKCIGTIVPLRRALEAHRYPWLQVQTLLEDGICQLWAGTFEQSSASTLTAVRLAEASGYPVLQLRAIGVSAALHLNIGNVAEALSEDGSGLARYWTERQPVNRAQQFYSNLRILAERTNSPYTNVAMARESAESAGLMGRRDFHAGGMEALAIAEITSGMYDRAKIHLRVAETLAAALSSPEKRRQLRLDAEILMATLEASRGEPDASLRRLLRIEPEVERWSDDLRRLEFETVLGRVRLQHRDYGESTKLLERALAIGEKRRAHTPAYARAQWVRAMTDTYRGLVECKIQSAADPRQALELWSQYRAAMSDAAPAMYEVAPGQAVLSFVELPSGFAAWLEAKGSLSFRRLDVPVKLLREAAGSLLRSCATERTPVHILQAEARKMSQRLLGPWDKELDGIRTVVIEADGPLSAVPWPALVRSNGHYWSDDFAVSIRAGAPPQDQPIPMGSLEGALAVGDPATGDAELPPLPEAATEAEKVYSLFPRSVLLVRQKATWTEIRERLGSARLFHFAGHGYGGEGGGLIVRGANGTTALLRAADIQEMDLSRCRLAVLSGCATGSGERNGPGDPQSLVRAFLHAGAREVVASFWNLDSGGSAAFMQAFYREMLTGATAAESLRAAAAAVRSGPIYMHPYYWAGLAVFSGS